MSLARETVRFGATCVVFRRGLARATKWLPKCPLLFEALVSSVIVRLYDAWAVRCRALVLQSARGGVLTANGRRVCRSSRLGRGGSPLAVLRQRWSRNRSMSHGWEPNWHVPDDAIRAASILQVDNEAEITAGLGADVVSADLRILRNVIAHSLPATWAKYRQLERRCRTPRCRGPAYFGMAWNIELQNRPLEHWMSQLALALAAAAS